MQTLTAPVYGTVQQLAIHTEGGVVTPAQALLAIVPTGSHLEIEAMVPNRDIGFVQVGQEAAIKIDTFNFTRYGLLYGQVKSTAEATRKAAVRKLAPISKRVHTITFDNGKEFADHQNMASALDADIFFAKPYHAWERGLNENRNGLIRDFFPKGTDFSTITAAEVAKVERLLNDRPRKSLGFKSPKEVFLAHAPP